MSNKIKTIVLGATGMVGEGVLHECLKHTEVDKVLVINRKPCGVTHEKLTEIIHKDFFDFFSIEKELAGYDACYFCMGVSSFGKKEEDYRRVTYDLTMHVAKTLRTVNPDMTFTYVSGSGTDSTENGRIMWGRVKGKTENDLLKLFKNSYMFRPGYIQPTKGLKNAYKIYKVFAPFYLIWKTLFPKYVCTLEAVGKAMIYVTMNGSEKRVLENGDIRMLAGRLS
jgi:uncharacterized protein YbjT (DUF2867 family)